MDQPARPRKASRQDVAELAGVAPSTVSLVLNGRAGEVRIATATRERIEAAARRLNYVPNAAARSLVRRHTRTVGLLLETPADGPQTPVYADVLLGAVQRCKELGYFVTVFPAVATAENDLLAEVRDADIAGLICEPGGDSRRLGRACERAGFPVVWLSRIDRPGRSGRWRVHIDARPGALALAHHLHDRGCRDVLILAGDEPTPADNPRYGPILQRFGRRARLVHLPGWRSEHGRAAVRAELDRGRRPAAVFGGNDRLAAGAIQALREAKLEVPGDVAVAGFGDFQTSVDLSPPLTTVRWPLGPAAERASDMLIGLIQGRERLRQRQTLDTELVVRQST